MPTGSLRRVADLVGQRMFKGLMREGGLCNGRESFWTQGNIADPCRMTSSQLLNMAHEEIRYLL